MFSMAKDSFLIRYLKWMERICIKFTNHVITPNISFRNMYFSLGCPPDKIDIVMNQPDENIFKLYGMLFIESVLGFFQ
jgi:hypothetical protein